MLRSPVITELVRRYGIALVFGVLFLALLAVSAPFRSPSNLVNLLQQSSIYGIIACGMVLMVVAGGFDLSVGSVAALSGVVAAVIFVSSPILAIPFGVAGGLLAGLVVGLLNGLLIAWVGMNPFIATLGTQILVRGLLFIATNARPIYGLPETFTVVGLGNIGPFPIATSIFFVCVIITYFVLSFSRFGHYIYAVGGNEEAARLNGVQVKRVKLLAYALGGVFAALGGLVLLGQSNIGQPAAAETWPLLIIAIVVIGGTPLTGGEGNILSVIVGTLIFGTLSNALNLLNASPYWQPAITGAIVLTSVALERYGSRLKRREV